MSDEQDSSGWISLPVDGLVIHAYDILQPEGYEVKPNYPMCCKNHMDMMSNADLWFAKFPECCPSHRALAKHSWFKREMFAYVPLKMVTQISYTAHFIRVNINENDWYQKIVFYIEHNQWSFGFPNVGFDHYLLGVKNFINTNEIDIHAEKKVALLAFIQKYFDVDPEVHKVTVSSFDTLEKIYKRWLEIFPFGTPYFRNLKARFANDLPMMTKSVETNPYSGLTKLKMLNAEELTLRLRKLTIQLLKEVNSQILFESGGIQNLKLHTLDLFNENHRIKQIGLLGDFTKPETDYLSIVEQWLTNERDYFSGLVSLNLIAPSNRVKPEVKNWKDIFNKETEYELVMQILIEAGYCDPETRIWIDSDKGGKGFLAALIKHLSTLGYYKENRKPTASQIQSIAENSLGFRISLDVIKKAKPKDHRLGFIPDLRR